MQIKTSFIVGKNMYTYCDSTIEPITIRVITGKMQYKLTCKPLIPARRMLSLTPVSAGLLWHIDENFETKKS